MDRKWRVAFLCKSNRCRSQIAEAIGKKFASDVMECYSAGVKEGDGIKERAIRLLKDTYGIDLTSGEYRPKLISELPEIDIIIYMGCNVECVQVPCQIELDWGILDKKDASDEEFVDMIREIEKKVLGLRADIISGRINLWRKENLEFDFSNTFPFWDNLTDKQKNRINEGWRTELIDKGRQIYRSSDGCKGLMIVRKGCLRVYMISDDGRDVTLYRLYPGEVCIFSAACLIREIDFDVLIEATEDTESVTIPATDLEQIMKENIFMESYIYKKTTEKFSDVMWTMQQILFKKIDQRIARYLWDEMQHQNSMIISTTHDNIAKDIGSSREIVTKVMKQMAGNGLIKNRYGKVEILDKNKLFEMI